MRLFDNKLFGRGVFTVGGLIPTATFFNTLVTNGDFSTDTDWTKGAGWTIGSGVLTATAAGSGTGVAQTVAIATTGSHLYTINVSAASTSYYSTFGGTSSGALSGTGVKKQEKSLTAGNIDIVLAAWSGGLNLTADNISVWPSDGSGKVTCTVAAGRVPIAVYQDEVLLTVGVDYTVAGNVVTMVVNPELSTVCVVSTL